MTAGSTPPHPNRASRDTDTQSSLDTKRLSVRRLQFWRGERLVSALPKLLLGIAILCAVSAGVILFVGGDAIEDRPVANESAQLPGTSYAGIVGAQQAEVRDEYRSHGFDSQLVQAATDDERADVMADELDAIEADIAALEAHKTDIRSERGNESVYRAQVTTHVSRSLAVEQRFDRVAEAATTLDSSLRDDFGLSSESLDTLEGRIDALTTPDMVDTARQIAGDDVGTGFDPSSPLDGDIDDTWPIADRANATLVVDDDTDDDVESDGDVVVTPDTEVDGDLEAGGSVVLERDAEVDGNLTAEGDVLLEVDAEVDGALVADGHVVLRTDTEVDGELEAGGDVLLEADAEVDGDLSSHRVGIHPSAEIDGDVSGETVDLDQ